MRILIAEDDPIIADGLSRSLRRGGYAIDCAHNGLDADTALMTTTYDLLILDLGLPKLSASTSWRACAPVIPSCPCSSSPPSTAAATASRASTWG